MQKLFQLSLLACLCLVLYGCPLQTQVPVDAKPHKIDTVLLGRWRGEKKDGVYTEYTVMKKSPTMYAITGREAHSDAYEVRYYYAYLSRVGGSEFLSVFSRDTTKHGYYLLKLDFASSGNTLKTSWVSEKNNVDISSPAELRDWINQNMDKRDFFDSTEITDIFHRVK